MKIFLIYGLFCLLLNCSSQIDLLRKEKPDYYNQLVNTTWFFFYPLNGEKLKGQIQLKENGKVIGNFSELLLENDYSNNLEWTYVDNKVVLISEYYNYNFLFNEKYNTKFTRLHPVYQEYVDDDKIYNIKISTDDYSNYQL